MSQQSWHAAFCGRLLGSWDRASLLRGCVQDVLDHLPVRALLLRVGDEYGTLGESAERVPMADECELWVAFGDDAFEGLGEILRAHFEACLGLVGRWEESQARVAHSSKMAAVGQLAAGVAHELNSPLGAVMMQLDAAQLNLERERYEKAADKMRSAARAAGTAKEIISKLLFYSRDGGGGERDVNLNEVVDDTLALLDPQLCYDNLELKVSLGDVPGVLANPNELQQVVTNLLLNARDAVLEPDAGGKVVEVRTYVHDGEVCLEVRDGGPGIAEQVLDQIFQPFFTTKPVGRGTGLGLSVSSKIVEQHGGRLTARNGSEGGACFVMALPVHGKSEKGDLRADGRHSVAGG